ncbi:MAG: Hsp70 family protein, partial [Planctomycetes bacterium]|nr:Hsp70 family protein [Planctomycetota bacterium]
MNIGIDLGTTFSSVAICYEEKDKLVVEEIELASANGETKIPSVIYVKKDGGTVVGAAALNYLATEPDRVFQWFKRDMGSDKPIRTVDGVGWTPQMLSAEILKVLKRDAEKWLEEMGEELTGTVVCVPAWFGDRQRAATREAIEMAGLTLVDMRAEPSAAALAVAMTRPDEVTDKHVLVYDLGGGTFDVVLIKTEKTDSLLPRITTLCRAGHFDLGGHNWDEMLAEHLCQRCFEEHKHNPKNDLREWVTTLERVEAGKRDYSREGEAVMFPVGLRGHAFEISLAEF